MTLDKVKNLFIYGWIAKDEGEDWHWFSKEPKLFQGDYLGYYWFGEDEITIGFLEDTGGICSVDSLMKVGE